MITVHHLNNSRSQRILWLLEELELPYQVKRYERDPESMLAPPELKNVHPLGRSPVIEEDGRVVAESGAIIEYLLDYHGNGRLRPEKCTPERLRFTFWLHYAEGSAMPPLFLRLVFAMLSKAPVPFFVKPVVKGIVAKVNQQLLGPELKLHLDFMEGELVKNKWFGGEEFTAADIQMSFPVEAAFWRGGATAHAYPKLSSFLDRLRARPAFQRALDSGGPYDLLRLGSG